MICDNNGIVMTSKPLWQSHPCDLRDYSLSIEVDILKGQETLQRGFAVVIANTQTFEM